MTPATTPPHQVPARMINEVCYCPRLFALEHVAGEWADNEHTVEGRVVHRRVDRPTTATLPDPDDDPSRPRVVRSVLLGSEELGLVARIDLCEVDGQRVVPVDYKKGEAPDCPHGAWDPERVQVAAQAMLLEAHGYTVPHAVLYFAGSRSRVVVEVDDALRADVLRLRDVARDIMASGAMPPPLEDSPKCRGCSLAGLCLPDEHHIANGDRTTEPRPLVPPRDDRVPLHVQITYGQLRLKGGELVVTQGHDEAGRARLNDTSQVILWGNVSVTTPALHALAAQDIPVALHSTGGWYQGTWAPASGHNVLSRIAQHATCADPTRSLAIARAMVEAKARNQRTMLRRNARDLPAGLLRDMKLIIDDIPRAADHDTLRGLEGAVARAYFSGFPHMLRTELREAFQMDGRNRRPPRDPVNALLSFAYACLTRECTHAAAAVGLDPYVGVLHVPRAGRPALALDLMEEFRPLIADSIVVNAINNGVVQFDDFQVAPTGVSLERPGRASFLRLLERRLDELVTHPTLGSRFSYRRMLEVQARFVAKVCLGEVRAYPAFTVR